MNNFNFFNICESNQANALKKGTAGKLSVILLSIFIWFVATWLISVDMFMLLSENFLSAYSK